MLSFSTSPRVGYGSPSRRRESRMKGGNAGGFDDYRSPVLCSSAALHAICKLQPYS